MPRCAYFYAIHLPEDGTYVAELSDGGPIGTVYTIVPSSAKRFNSEEDAQRAAEEFFTPGTFRVIPIVL